jgi:hypothetical protein
VYPEDLPASLAQFDRVVSGDLPSFTMEKRFIRQDSVEETWRVFGKHYWEYGIAPNRPAFEAMGRYMFEQGLAPRLVTPEEMFLACE